MFVGSCKACHGVDVQSGLYVCNVKKMAAIINFMQCGTCTCTCE